ncbi:helix-turn-helix transcriptional regulator [Streptomyces europaeiscabiei]|uniref:helix-turn-helix domain-containing protein n=1 Tax=Streptomyces europaeiscabiei TaxID=146819 RepID=UPI002E2C1FD5|nr:helix-turn-helix transcriptional regulator [Streptomyces europaeiscabiei]
MPKPKAIDPSRSTRAMHGAELRHRRERAGLSQEELGAAMFISGAYVGMLEVGTRRMQPEFAKMVDEVLDTDGFFTQNLEAARKIPGLLQTAAYTRAVVRAYELVLTGDVVEERVAARQVRAHIFDDPRKPRHWAVLDEMVLRRPVGGPTGMAEQLRHIAGMLRRRRIIVHVLPLTEGANAGEYEDAHRTRSEDRDVA